MRFSAQVRLAALIPLAALCFPLLTAQESSVLPLTGGTASADLPTLVQTLKAIGQIRQVEADAAQASIRVNGTSEEIALARWLARALDRPQGAPAPKDAAQSEYRLPDGSGLWIRVFYLSHARSPQAQMELVTAIRSMGDVRMILPSARQSAICMRGPEPQIRLAAWLIGELDQPDAAPSRSEARWRDYPAAFNGDTVRLYRLPEGPARKELTGNLAALAQTTGVQRLCPISGPGSERSVLAARAKPEQLEKLERALYQTR